MMTNQKIKKILVVALIILMICQNIFAAIVSDNDGSAFVMKSEFEVLKKNFDEQIKNYNDSIDSKIDGAIASYLAGIKLEKTEILDNNYEKIEKNKKLKWISATNYQNTAAISGFIYDYTHIEWYPNGHVSVNIQCTKAGRKSDNNWMFDEIFYCTHNNDKVYVDSLRDLLPAFSFQDDYVFGVFGGYTSTTQTEFEVAGRSPENWVTGITLNNTIQSHEYRNNGNLDKGKSRLKEDQYDAGSNRYIWCVARYSVSTDKTYDYLTLSPKSASNTYYYQSDCTEACTNGGYSALKYNVDGWDSKGWSSSVTESTNAMNVTSEGTTYTYKKLNLKNFANWSNTIGIPNCTSNVPWVNKQVVSKNLRYKVINDASGIDYPIHYGILLTTITANGKLSFKVHSDYAGQLVLYRGSTPIADLATSTNADVKKANIGTSATSIEIENCQKNDNIYMVYVPTDTTKKATLTFDTDLSLLLE